MGVRTYLYTYFAGMRKQKSGCSELNIRLIIPIQVVVTGKSTSIRVSVHFRLHTGRSAPDS